MTINGTMVTCVFAFPARALAEVVDGLHQAAQLAAQLGARSGRVLLARHAAVRWVDACRLQVTLLRDGELGAVFPLAADLASETR